ncbi:MAG: hypothetical protein KIS92_20175 [Planctomycetota bacterium]|nr:hypothetical protein [Planctomycetota bacterium]
MPLERKPADANESQPEYPDSAEYSADRRGFLALIGVVAAGSVGYFAYKAFSRPAVAMPGAMPVPPSNTQNVQTPAGQPTGTCPVEPKAGVPGEASVPVKQPDPAEPKVQAPGKVSVESLEVRPQPQPPVEPKAAVPGGIAPPPPQQQPQPNPNAEPRTNIKGGAGMMIKRTNRRQQA